LLESHFNKFNGNSLCVHGLALGLWLWT